MPPLHSPHPRDDGLHSQFIRAFCVSPALQDAVVAAIGEMPALLGCSKLQRRDADDACAHLLRVARRVVSTVFDEGRRCRGAGR